LRSLLLAVVALLLLPASGVAGPRIRTVDVSNYPLVRVVVVTPSGAGPARPGEDSHPVVGYVRRNLGREKAVVLAIDRSRSMRGAPLESAIGAVGGFIATKPQSDEMEIVAFGSRAVALTHFSQATIDGDLALRTIAADYRAGTALYDAVTVAASDLREQPLAGRVLILLTDGRDSGSFAHLNDAIDAARRARIVVYAVAIGDADLRPLGMLTQATGGRLYRTDSADALTSIYAHVRAELARTWSLSFVTARRPGDSVRVSVGSAAKIVRLPGRPAHSTRSSAFFASAWGAFLLAILAGGLIGAAAAAFRRAHRLRQIQIRVESELPEERLDGGGTDGETPRFGGTFVETMLNATENALDRQRIWLWLEGYLERAGIKLRTVELVFISAFVGFGLALLVAFRGSPPFVTLAALLIGSAIPTAIVAILARRRVRAFDAQLPDVLATIAASLRAGHGLKHALSAIADEGGAPACDEFTRVLSEARLGRPLEDAMVAMCTRIGSRDLEYVASAISVQAMVGGSMAGLFDLAAETVRQRQQHARKLRALTSTGRASATVLTALPFGLAAFMTLVNPEYMLPFFRSSAGQTLTVISIVSISIAGVILVKLISVKD